MHRNRSLHTRSEPDGTFVLELRTTVDAGVKVLAVIEAERERLFRAARLDGRREPHAAYAADALVNVCTRTDAPATGSAGSRAKVIVRIDYDALVRGHNEHRRDL